MLRIKNFFKTRGLSVLKILFILFVFIFVTYGIVREAKAIDFVETITVIRNLPIIYTLLLIVLGLFAVSSITLYDFIIVKYLNMKLKPLFIFRVSFAASTVNNISGLGGLTGASIRSIFFRKELKDKEDIIDYNLLLIPATAVGLGIMAVISLIEYRYIFPIIREYRVLLLALIGFSIYLILYFFIDMIFYRFMKIERIQFNPKRIMVKLKLLIASTIEWVFAYIMFLIILKLFSKDVNIYGVMGIFTLASIAGIVSMLPGGVGSFDLVVLLGLQDIGVPLKNIIASLILYRFFYYILPLILGVVFTLLFQIKDKNNSRDIFHMEKFQGVVNRTSDFINVLLSILVFFSGAVLLISALVPGISERIRLATKLLSFPILQLSHQISITVGFLLITISKDIAMKVKKAYKFTWWLLLLGGIFTFLKGFDYEEAIFLGIVLILLKMSKKSFHRRSIPFDWFGTLVLSIFILLGGIFYFKLSHIIIMDFLKVHYFKTLFARGFTNIRFNGLITYGFFMFLLVIRELTKEKIVEDPRYETLDEERVKEFLENKGGSFMSHLLYLGDKHIYWASSNEVIIGFEVRGNIAIVLGDPIGNPKYFGEAIEEFRDFIDEYGYKLVFYEVSDELLPMYHDHGYYFFKLGETALIDLEEFDISSSKNRDFRNVLSRFKRDGYYFELKYMSDIDDSLYQELKSISDEWLEDRNELGFSLGFMNRKYLEHSPLAFIKKVDTDEIIAFASLMPKYDNGKSMSLDLMRFKKQVPNNTMTFLILGIILSLKDNGYKIFNLGMAPLSNVGESSNSHFREKLAHLVFKYGNNVYGFKGLRNYKNKFRPIWISRYLAYEDLTLLPSSIIEVTRLIHSKK